jgi:hypothetical protein
MMTVPFGCRRFLVSIGGGGEVNPMHESVLEVASTSPFRFANMTGNEWVKVGDPDRSAILLITNSLWIFRGIHGLFWVGGFTVFRMLCHLDAAFCVECV